MKREALNKVTHTIRASQLISRYGVGAMVEFPDQTLMTAAPEEWENNVTPIYDERLAKALHVDYFGLPIPVPGDTETCEDMQSVVNRRIAYIRFPEWYFCPCCQSFKPLSQWIEDWQAKGSKEVESDPYMVKHMRCSSIACKRQKSLVPARLVVICDKGHISDFPWVEWVHYKDGKGRVCDHPDLEIHTGGSVSSGLEGIHIKCRSCKAEASLKGVLGKGFFEELDKKNGTNVFTCKGDHPWKHAKEACLEHPQAVLRGASMIHYPVVISSLLIPPYTSNLRKAVEDSAIYAGLNGNTGIGLILSSLEDLPANSRNQVLMDYLNKAADKIASETGADAADIRKLLEEKWIQGMDDVEDEPFDEVRYKEEEYEALSGQGQGQKDSPDLLKAEQDIKAYEKLPFLRQVVLVHKLKEVRAMIGFSRVKPVAGADSEGFVSVKRPSTRWYPGYEVCGEGIFLDFRDDLIQSWVESNQKIIRRAKILQENYDRSFIGKNKPRTITPEFMLLHSVAHVLIKQLSFECGYGIASLRERIYCDAGDGDKHMSGILIYTASGDSEGTLGGLVRQGYRDSLQNIFAKAIDGARQCSNDPVCSLSNGQGRDALNLSACHSCLLLPETSCEEFNSFLDRGMILGTLDDPDIGFFQQFQEAMDLGRY